MRILGGAALAIMLLASTAAAQQQSRRGFIGIAFGPSAPLGNFADASPANGRAGRAKPGYNNSLLSVGWRFGNRLGAAATASYGEYFVACVGSRDAVAYLNHSTGVEVHDHVSISPQLCDHHADRRLWWSR